MIDFATLDQVRAWAKINASDIFGADLPLRLQKARDLGRRLNEYCNTLPLSRDYLQYRMSATPAARLCNTAGWHARGEQLLWAAVAAGIAMGPERWGGPTCPMVFGHNLQQDGEDERPEFRALHLATNCLLATPYLWSHRILQTITASPPLPPHVISRAVLPFPLMFWSLETAYPLVSSEGRVGEMNWILIIDQGDSFATVFDSTPSAGTSYRVEGGSILYGAHYPDEVLPQQTPTASSLTGLIVDLVLKFLSFLHSPYIRAEGELIDRAFRRRCARVSPTEANKPVHVVTLRRPTEGHKPPEESSPGHPWQHQWWVTGHHRAQWYPSEKAHRVIWIAPYLKGPTDKPVLEKVYAVKH